ncbi:MAG: phosphatase family protein [Sphingomonas bacterium]|nr:phosphatase family protein [Sphingomonas bacterium]
MAAPMAAGFSRGLSSRSAARPIRPFGGSSPSRPEPPRRNHSGSGGLNEGEHDPASPMRPTSPVDPSADIRDAVADASAIERADVEVTKAAAPYRHTLPVRIAGQLSELADQPPLISICAATLALGLVTGDRRLARSGGRMLASELLATAIKSAVKKSIDRTRPKLLVDEGRYRMAPGSTDEHPINSFPSGHTAGAVTVARAFARDYPEHAGVAYLAASAAALVQIPRCTHYPSDLAAGAAVGIVAELAVSAVLDRAWPADVQDDPVRVTAARPTSA